MYKREIERDGKLYNDTDSIWHKFRRNITDAEKYFWNMVRYRRLFNLKFRRRQLICGFTVDFFCPGINLIIEIDGYADNKYIQREYNEWKSKVLERSGYNVLRFKNYEVLMKPESVMERIREYMH